MSPRTFDGRVPQAGSARSRATQPIAALMTIALAAVLGSVTVAPFSHAQTYTASEAMERATAIAAELEQAGDCDLALHGSPQLDETSKRWLMAYSGTGSGCDDAGATLQREGAELEITFFRRPNADEVKALIARMRSSVRKGFGCLISFRGEPRFNDESSLWMVRYYTSGQQCEDAGEELERQGRELRVLFHRLR